MRVTLHLLPLALLASTGLVACQRGSAPLSALPLTTAAAAPLAEAPPPGALPSASPTPISWLAEPNQDYAFADRAWAMEAAFGDSPPDWAFDDDGVTPWVWQADDGAWLLAEPCPGGERYYYYQAGASEPYFVEDPNFGYGYEGGDLVVVYDHAGRVLPRGDYGAYAEIAGRYLARGQALRQTASRAAKQAVAASNWNARRGVIAEQTAVWRREAATNPDWRAYHAQHATEEQAHWAPEASRREIWAAQTDARLGDQARAAREQDLARADAPRPATVFRPPATALPREAAGAAQTPGAAPQRLADASSQRQLPFAAAPSSERGAERAFLTPRAGVERAPTEPERAAPRAFEPRAGEPRAAEPLAFEPRAATAPQRQAPSFERTSAAAPHVALARSEPSFRAPQTAFHAPSAPMRAPAVRAAPAPRAAPAAAGKPPEKR